MSDKVTAPELGEMYLYDFMKPPLPADSYRLDAETTVKIDGEQQDLPGSSGYFEIVGPRFTLSSSEVGGVFPPNNGRGSFSHSIPHIALKRRTLPWERSLERIQTIGSERKPDDPAPPWMALLLLEEDEYQLIENMPLKEVVGARVFERMESPPGIRCNAIEVESSLLAEILPSVEELQMLTHVRQVNKDDRELSAGDSGGWFAVVMGNRMPRQSAECRVCLVSLEERTDLLKLVNPDPPEVFISTTFDKSASIESVLTFVPPEVELAVAPAAPRDFERPIFVPARPTGEPSFFLRKSRIVLLYSWKFFNEGFASFRELLQRLDVDMMGTRRDGAKPKVTDTGHLPVKLQNRDGIEENVLYRGPLVPFPLSRDTLGPYHSADQARRVSAEAGAEDVSYAAAFEVGRLLAAADGRLGQELLRWRQDAYRQSVRIDDASILVKNLRMTRPLDLHSPVLPFVATQAMDHILEGVGPLADPYGLGSIAQAPGLDPAELQTAWNLDGLDEAAAILGRPGDMVTVPAPAPTVERAATTIDQVAANTQLLDHLSRARDRVLKNVSVRMEE